VTIVRRHGDSAAALRSQMGEPAHAARPGARSPPYGRRVSSDLRHRLGVRGEELAARHLERRGLRILDRNYRTRFGELDLVATDDYVLVFCEVKTRGAGSGDPWQNLGEAKRREVRSMGAIWLAEVHDRPRTSELRFDAIGIRIDHHGALVSLDHLQGAF
jgi:putative endonuclease